MNAPSKSAAGCVAVNDHISRPIPETLWHYTSFAGFQGIITSKQIWATEYRFLNDLEEFRHAKKLALRTLCTAHDFAAFSRKVVGWSMRPDMQRNMVIDALYASD
jgi:hypothetical protein